MAGKQAIGEVLPANLAGMSKNQLYDIVSQMKMLIEQNQQQARQILIQNPMLTKALFQAQIMLGMVQPPKQMPNIQAATPQNPQQSAMMNQQSNTQSTRILPVPMAVQDQTGASKLHTSERNQQQNQQASPISSSAVPSMSAQAQPARSVQSQPPLVPLQASQQSKVYQIPQMSNASILQSSQSQPPTMAPIPMHSSAPLLHQTQIPNASIQLQQSLLSSGNTQMSLQPPMQPQSRPHSAPNFHHHYPSGPPQMGYQSASAPQHVSQPMYHSVIKPPAGVGPSFPQGQQPPLSSQTPPQSLYQAGGQQLGSEFNNQIGNPVQGDGRQSWRSGMHEMTAIPQVSGPPPVAPIQTGSNNQPSQPAAPLTPEMEKALLQQVMSLTPDQINLLPPEQRNQVFQLQQMLRQ